MEIILFDKDYGLYEKDHVVGKEGHFITSPLVSKHFSHCIAKDFVRVSNGEKISNILWTQEPESFLPHSTSRSKELINISDKPEPLDHSNLLINLNDKSCDSFSRFDSVTEIIISDPTNIKAKKKATHNTRGLDMKLPLRISQSLVHKLKYYACV